MITIFVVRALFNFSALLQYHIVLLPYFVFWQYAVYKIYSFYVWYNYFNFPETSRNNHERKIPIKCENYKLTKNQIFLWLCTNQKLLFFFFCTMIYNLVKSKTWHFISFFIVTKEISVSWRYVVNINLGILHAPK